MRLSKPLLKQAGKIILTLKGIMPFQAPPPIIPRQRVKMSLHWKISPRGRTAFTVAANFAKKKKGSPYESLLNIC